VAPTQDVAVIIEDGAKKLITVRWGLVPAWAGDLSAGSRLINARAETLMERASFKEAFHSRRCLVVADGFYEWQKAGGPKRPNYIRLRDGRAFGFAGLYERWVSSEKQTVTTCTIITCEPNDIMRPIHNRMPVIIPQEMEDRWLDRNVDDASRLLNLLKPYPSERMRTPEVSSLVNSPANDSPDCVAPVAERKDLRHPTLPFID
jgi:putative SOS response-associated peptidase YedK